MENSSKLNQLADKYLSAGRAERTKMLSPYTEDDQRAIIIKSLGLLLSEYRAFSASK